MKPLKSFSVSQQFNYPKQSQRFSFNLENERTNDHTDFSRYSAAPFTQHTPTHRVSTETYKPQYNTTPGRGVLRSPNYVDPFYQPEKSRPFTTPFESQRYLEADFKSQIERAKDSQFKNLAVDLIILGVSVYVPIWLVASWSIAFLMFCVGGVNIYCKSNVSTTVPIAIQVMFNFLLIIAIIDQFLSYDPQYQVATKLVFGIPITLYIIYTEWQKLFIAKIPIDSWNKWLGSRIVSCLVSPLKQYLSLKLFSLTAALVMLCGSIQLFYYGIPLQNLIKYAGENILIKIAMFYLIYYTIEVSNVIEAYSENKNLSKVFRELRLFLWLFRIRDKRHHKLHFKAIKHLNQIIYFQKDILQRQLPLKSKNQQYYWDIIISFTTYFFQQILTFNLPQQKNSTFEDVKIIKSKDGILDDLTIYFKKMNSFVGLNLQNIRIRQQLQLVAALCNIFVKSKAFQMQYGGRLALGNELVSKIIEMYKYFNDILDKKFVEHQSSRKVVEYLKNSSVYLSQGKASTFDRSFSEMERLNPKLKLFR